MHLSGSFGEGIVEMMSIESKQYDCWALSHKFDWGRSLLGPGCWMLWHPAGGWAVRIRLFRTRKQAREAQADCCYKPTRVERVRVVVEVI